MSQNRRANAVTFGFDFQSNAAIILMLKNIGDLSSLRLEGNYEDIELELSDGKYIFAQAKAVEKSSTDFRNVRKNLKNALVSLSEANNKHEAKQLILITNSPNPLKDDASKSIFYGKAIRSFSSLPKSSQKIIKGYLSEIDSPLDPEKCTIQILPFETDDKDERYKVVKQEIDDFIGSLNINTPGIGKKLMIIWQNEVFFNSTKSDAGLKLDKKSLIWPVIVIATDIKNLTELPEQMDFGMYDEIVHKYGDLIDSCNERYEFYIRVLHDYNLYASEHPRQNNNNSLNGFIAEKYVDYNEEFEMESESKEIQTALVKVILYTIIRNRYAIERIKKGTNL